MLWITDVSQCSTTPSALAQRQGRQIRHEHRHSHIKRTFFQTGLTNTGLLCDAEFVLLHLNWTGFHTQTTQTLLDQSEDSTTSLLYKRNHFCMDNLYVQRYWICRIVHCFCCKSWTLGFDAAARSSGLLRRSQISEEIFTGRQSQCHGIIITRPKQFLKNAPFGDIENILFDTLHRRFYTPGAATGFNPPEWFFPSQIRCCWAWASLAAASGPRVQLWVYAPDISDRFSAWKFSSPGTCVPTTHFPHFISVFTYATMLYSVCVCQDLRGGVLSPCTDTPASQWENRLLADSLIFSVISYSLLLSEHTEIQHFGLAPPPQPPLLNPFPCNSQK